MLSELENSLKTASQTTNAYLSELGTRLEHIRCGPLRAGVLLHTWVYSVSMGVLEFWILSVVWVVTVIFACCPAFLFFPCECSCSLEYLQFQGFYVEGSNSYQYSKTRTEVERYQVLMSSIYVSFSPPSPFSFPTGTPAPFLPFLSQSYTAIQPISCLGLCGYWPCVCFFHMCVFSFLYCVL